MAMKITNHGISQTPPTPKTEISPAVDGPRETTADSVVADSDAYSASAEFVRMLDLVKQQPEVREDRVQQVLERLQRGEYFSPQSAEETADAMIGSLS